MVFDRGKNKQQSRHLSRSPLFPKNDRCKTCLSSCFRSPFRCQKLLHRVLTPNRPGPHFPIPTCLVYPSSMKKRLPNHSFRPTLEFFCVYIVSLKRCRSRRGVCLPVLPPRHEKNKPPPPR